MPRYTEEKISGIQKAAILLIALGPEKSSLIFKHLKEEEIEELTLEIANTRSVTPQVKEEVINELIKANANELRAKKGYEVKGAGANKEFVSLNNKNTKS